MMPTTCTLQGEGEDLFGDNMERDYQPIPELDTYEEDLIDRGEYATLSPGARYFKLNCFLSYTISFIFKTRANSITICLQFDD